LDRLLLLLDTGSSTSVRSTAAKQLAQLAVKSVITDVAFVEEDIKTVRQNVAFKDEQAWSELLAVLARVCPHFLSILSRLAHLYPDTSLSSLKIS
jgi:TATA-binding protein-associated factor